MFAHHEKQNERGARSTETPAALRGRTAHSAPSYSNTRETKQGASLVSVSSGLSGRTLDGSESVRIITHGKHQRIELTPLPKPDAHPGIAHVDYLAFTWSPPDILPPEGKANPVLHIYEHLQSLLTVSASLVHTGHGGNGYEEQQDIKTASGVRLGFIQHGGERQRGTVHVELTGEGCAHLADWQAVKAWLDEEAMRITRADLAHDDLEGQTFTMEKVRDMYQRGDFNSSSGGRTPSHNVVGDWFTEGSPKGRTLYIGRRENGKMLRFYEKGKQLGDSASPWVRVELELRGKNRIIPSDVLTEPGNYLAGSYPAALGFLSTVQEKIRTITKAARISFAQAVENGRQAVGKLINVMMMASGGDAFQVISELKRDGYPKRLQSYAESLSSVFVTSHGQVMPEGAT